MMDDATTDPGVGDFSEKLLESGGITLDRLPMLKVIVDRLAGICAEAFRNFTSAPVYMPVRDVSVGRIGQILDSYETRAIVAIYQVTQWDSRLIIGLDLSFVYSIVEVLFGGDGSEPVFETERSLTNVEIKVAHRAFDLAIQSLKSAFSSVADLTFVHERTEARLEFAVAGRRSNMAVIARIGLQVLDRSGELFVLIPQQALNPLRQLLGTNVSNQGMTHDPRWSKQIEKEVQRAEVALRAIADSYDLALEEVARWQIGDVIPMKPIEEAYLRLEAEGQPIFVCELGRAKGFYTVRIIDAVDPEAEFMDDVMGKNP